VSSVSGQFDLIVEVEVPSIDRLNTLRDLIASHGGVEDLTTAIVLRRDIASAPWTERFDRAYLAISSKDDTSSSRSSFDRTSASNRFMLRNPSMAR
jgi:hypothetical protein